MHSIGIDWADSSHQIAILTAEGQCISEFAIDHTSQDISKFCGQLTLLAPVQVSIERPDGLLVDQLLEAGIDVYVIPPRIAAHRRPRQSKDDRGDARLLANLLRTGDDDCRRLERHGSTVETLNQLLQAFEQLQRQQLRTSNQLRQIVKQYYPVLLVLFSDVSTGIALSFLETYPDPKTAQQLTPTELKQFLKAHHYTHPRRLDSLYQHLRQTPLETRVWQGFSVHAQMLIPILRLLNQQLASLKRSIRDTFGHICPAS
jgi:hypothetical protein